jgi:tetratricopeptide (TPR) repeat protein
MSNSQESGLVQTALAFLQQGKLELAEAACRTCLTSAPLDIDAWQLLGAILAGRNEPHEAISCLRKAVDIAPGHAGARETLRCLIEQYSRSQLSIALRCRDEGRLDDAEAICGAALEFDSASIDALFLAGTLAAQRKSFARALELLQRVLDLQPDHVEAAINKGKVLYELGRCDAAAACYDLAIALGSDSFDTHLSRGTALASLGQYESALTSFDTAIARNPDHAQAHSDRGRMLAALARFDAALESYHRAIALDPKDAQFRVNKALALLTVGDLAHGWPLLEWRWKTAALAPKMRRFTQPLWLGAEALAGKTLLLHGEQGLGDTIQLCRFTGEVAKRGAKVLLEVPAPLLGLLQGIEGIERLLPRGSRLPDFDLHCPLLSLPLALDIGLATIPAPQAYLHANPGEVAAWAKKLGVRSKPRVGIAWSGNPRHGNDRDRSIALATLLHYLPPDFEYVSLQNEVRDNDLEALGKDTRLRHFGDQLDTFAATAALCSLMDLVVSVDTSVAHLAGAIGKRAWILLPCSPDWRWLLDRRDSPWYPSVTLYRQDARREWGMVLDQVRSDLLRLAPDLYFAA